MMDKTLVRAPTFVRPDEDRDLLEAQARAIADELGCFATQGWKQLMAELSWKREGLESVLRSPGGTRDIADIQSFRRELALIDALIGRETEKLEELNRLNQKIAELREET